MTRITVAAFVVCCTGAWAADLNALSDMKVRASPGGAQVVVEGTRPPTFTVFRLNEPDRLVVDVSGADVGSIKGHHEGVGPIAGLVVSQFSDAHATVGRVLVSLDKASQYDVRAEGSRVVISVTGAATDGAGPAAPALASRSAQTPEPQPAAPAPVAAPPSPASDVVASQVDEQPVQHPAQHLVALSMRNDVLRITTDGEVAKYELIQLKDPPRLAIDLYGVSGAVRVPRMQSAALKNLRLGAHSDKLRLVMDVVGAMPAFRVSRNRHGLTVDLGGPPPPSAPVATLSPDPKGLVDGEIEIDGRRVAREATEERALASPLKAAKAAVAEVRDLSFEDAQGGGRVLVKFSGDATWAVEHPDAKTAVLTLSNARLPKKLERSFDASALDTPVKMVSAFQVPGDQDKVRVVVASSAMLEDTTTRVPQGLSWRMAAKGVKTEDVAVTQKAAGFASEAPAYAEESAPRQHRHYVGKKVSFEFKDIDIHNLLRVIAEISKKNMVVADDVGGKVTIRLRNVPWDEALDLILRSKSLGKEELGDVMRVAPLKTLEDEARSRAERKKLETISLPLVVQLIPVNYAGAGEMSARVKEVLSERGTVSVDSRTNVLIVRDVATNISKARSLVQSLDLQTPQVLIESRIVEANVTYTRSLGVQWGGQAAASYATGNPTGLTFPATAVATGGIEGTSPGVQAVPNFAVNMPAGAGLGQGGAVGFVFGSAGGALQLNLRLSAAESEGVVKTISAPKVTTLDNVSAKISQGVSIPFSQVSAAGVNTSFIEARLSLDVTPHVTQDGSVHLTIVAQNNQPDPANTGANGQPAIQRKEANTQVLVKDGDTTVIGGIYTRRASTAIAEVPFFARIPILGFFFKTTADNDNRQELLIFITPRILNRQTVAQNL